MERQENEPLAKFIERRGREKGIEEGRALAVIELLELRGVAVDDASRQRILECDDADTLRAWHLRAATAARVEALFAG